PGEFRFAFRSIFPIDERLQLFDEKSAVTPKQSLASFPLRWIDPRRRRPVFMNALLARVRDRDDDQRLHQFLADQALRRFVHAPFHPGKRRRRIEHVLAVMQIEHRILPGRKPAITGRQINEYIPAVLQNFGRERAMLLDVSGQRVRRHEKRNASRGVSDLSRNLLTVWLETREEPANERALHQMVDSAD